jgi:hypothetical protein
MSSRKRMANRGKGAKETRGKIVRRMSIPWKRSRWKILRMAWKGRRVPLHRRLAEAEGEVVVGDIPLLAAVEEVEEHSIRSDGNFLLKGHESVRGDWI